MKLAAVVCRKELLDNARDRRALFSTLLFGPLFAPLLFSALINFGVSRNITSVEEPLDIPILGKAPNLTAFLEARGIVGSEDHGLDSYDAAVAAVRDGRVDLALVIDDDFAAEFGSDSAPRVTLIFDRSNSRTNSRLDRARDALNGYAQRIGALRLLARGIHPSVLRPLIVEEHDVSTPAGRSALLLGMLTYFFLLAMLMGGLHLAIDTTAGERERKSLEPLLATPIARGSLLLGKLAATVCYMLLSLALTLSAFTVAVRFLPLDELGMSSSFGMLTALKAFFVFAPLAPFGAALMTLVASFTKSYKEAQTYLGFVILVPTLPLVFASMLNVAPSIKLMWIPSLSQHLLVTDLIRDEPLEIGMLSLSMVSAVAFAALLTTICIRLYKREALLG